MIPLLARGLAPSAAVASGLLSPVAIGASGDLDTTFADVGRMVDFDVPGQAWSLEPLEDDGVLFAGGDACLGWYCYYDYAYSFVGQVSGTGSLDSSYAAARLVDVEIFDVALQPDGKAVIVGRTVHDSRGASALTIARLERDGALDLTFGEDGVVRSPTRGLNNSAGAVMLLPDGRFLVAGSEGGRLFVSRLLANGAVDDSFASSGTFVGPDNRVAQRIHILRTAAGGYRITANSIDACYVVGLTENGAPDPSFGNAGVKTVGGPPGNMRCNSMAAQDDGRLLLAGRTSTGAFVTRLLASGEADPSFVPTVLPDLMTDATALAIGPNDSVLVAGRGPTGVSGATIVRLQADGELDVLFGNAGTAWIDLPVDAGSRPEIHDMAVLPDGDTIAGGGYFDNLPFLVRLVGDGGPDGPGVVGIKQTDVLVGENSQQTTVTVRRSGGAMGRISVAYKAVEPDWESARAGVDFTEVSGRLTWEDGDTTERAIVLPILQDAAFEDSEWFLVVLEDVQGGGGLGASSVFVQIADDDSSVTSAPAGSARRGGGALGVLSLLLLGLARVLRYSRSALDSRWRAPP
jgi:uncharacterized delta-60 repeat protein